MMSTFRNFWKVVDTTCISLVFNGVLGSSQLNESDEGCEDILRVSLANEVEEHQSFSKDPPSTTNVDVTHDEEEVGPELTADSIPQIPENQDSVSLLETEERRAEALHSDDLTEDAFYSHSNHSPSYSTTASHTNQRMISSGSIDFSSDDSSDELIPAENPPEEYQREHYDLEISSSLIEDDAHRGEDSSDEAIMSAEDSHIIDESGMTAFTQRHAEIQQDAYQSGDFELTTDHTIDQLPQRSNQIEQSVDDVLEFDDFSDDDMIPVDHPVENFSRFSERDTWIDEDEGKGEENIEGGIPSPPENKSSFGQAVLRDKKKVASLDLGHAYEAHESKSDRSLSPLSRRSLTSSPIQDIPSLPKITAPIMSSSQSQLPPLQTSGLSIRY